MSKKVKALSKKSMESFKENAGQMADLDFRAQGISILSTVRDVVKEAIEQGKINSKHFLNGVNKELDLLTRMVDSNEYTSEQKIAFAQRIAKLVDKLEQKDIIGNIGVIAAIGLLGWTIIKMIIPKK